MLRIVSLIASATEIVHALGLGEFQVGRSHECDFPPAVTGLPVCTQPRFDVHGSSQEIDRRVKETLASATSVYEVFEETLERLAPTHILTQTQCRVCAVSAEDVERALGARFSSRPQVVALEPNALADVWEDMRRVARACGVAARGEDVVQTLRSRMEEIAERAAGAGQKPRLACIEWPEPLMAAGNWVPELVGMLGAVNLFGAAGRHSPWMSFEELARADPDVIALMPCGYDLRKTRAESRWLTRRDGWGQLRAVREGRVYLTDGNQYFNRPGPRLVESLEILAEILYPDVFAPRWDGEGWAACPPSQGLGAS